MKMIRASDKTYILQKDPGGSGKWPLLAEIRSAHTHRHLRAAEILMKWAEQKGLTKEQLLAKRQDAIEKANED